jgi:hypothetical protein
MLNTRLVEVESCKVLSVDQERTYPTFWMRLSLEDIALFYRYMLEFQIAETRLLVKAVLLRRNITIRSLQA